MDVVGDRVVTHDSPKSDAIAKAKADYVKAKADWNRAFANWKKAKADWDKVDAELKKVDAELKKADADYDKAAADWSKAQAMKDSKTHDSPKSDAIAKAKAGWNKLSDRNI
jgi:multidrug resistance efflux pump